MKLNQHNLQFLVDREKKTISIKTHFSPSQSIDRLTWMDVSYIHQWWTPKLYREVTKSINFASKGRWYYYMVGPKGKKCCNLFAFESIETQKVFYGTDIFCNETSKIDQTKPTAQWYREVFLAGDETCVGINSHYNTACELETIVDIYFVENFTESLTILQQYLDQNQ